MGRIEVICGSMFSGKTKEIIRRINELKNTSLKYKVFKPKLDTRNNKDSIKSHNNIEIPAQSVNKALDNIDYKNKFDVIVIDEAQFFSDDIVDVCNELANSGKRVIIAGLDMDYSGKPFGPMPYLMAIAEEVTKLHAICSDTRNPALYSYRKLENSNVILIGEKDEYEPLSREAFVLKMKKK